MFCCAALFPLGVFVFSRSFVADAAAASAMGRRKRVADARVATVRGGVMRSVVRKEMRLLERDPLLLSQIGLQLVYLLPLGFILLRPDGWHTADRSGVRSGADPALEHPGRQPDLDHRLGGRCA